MPAKYEKGMVLAGDPDDIGWYIILLRKAKLNFKNPGHSPYWETYSFNVRTGEKYRRGIVHERYFEKKWKVIAP